MKWMRKLLFPFAAIYFLITLTRNWCYKRGIFTSTSYAFPVICIGNLNTGGTGKSPMSEYLIRLLQDTHKTTVLSRGYGRKTKGYRQVTSDMLAVEVGDEPLQFAKKFPKATVVVCEDRRAGITQIIQELGTPDVLVLDDAFQHRRVQAGYHILLTAYGDLYSDDFVLPAGNLRESRKGAHRADVIVVTKCPSNLSVDEQQSIVQKLGAQPTQQIFFAVIQYSDKVFGVDSLLLKALRGGGFTLLTGIANPSPLVAHLKEERLDFEHVAFGDHHNFTNSEIQTLDTPGIILTTEKDFVRLDGRFKIAQLYYLPIETQFLNNGAQFEMNILNFVRQSS